MARKIQVILVVLLLLGSMSAAVAQFGDEGPSKFGIRLMSFMPMSGQPRDVKSVWLGPAIDWHLNRDEDGRPLSYLTLGLLSSGQGSRKASNNFLTYTRINRRPISEGRSHYAGYGAGVYRLGYRRDRTYYDPGINDSGFQFGIHALYGQEFKDTYFAELRIDLMPKWRDAEWGGIFLSVGSRVSM